MCHCTACSSKSPFVHNSSFDFTYERYHMNRLHVKLYIYCSSLIWGGQSSAVHGKSENLILKVKLSQKFDTRGVHCQFYLGKTDFPIR